MAIYHFIYLAASEFINRLNSEHGWVIPTVCLVAGIIAGILSTRILSSIKFRKQNRLLDDTVNSILQEHSKADAILTGLDVGVVAYGADGAIINFNPAFCKIMDIETPPPTLQNFLTDYGTENGLHAGIILGTGSNEATYETERKVIKIKLKQTVIARNTKPAAVVLVQDITRQELEEKRRKEFVANVSHELRTPLTTIKTYSESLLDWGIKEKNKESIRKDVNRIHDDAERMSTLVENLLLLSRIDNKRNVGVMDQLDLTALVRSVVDRLQIQAEEKRIRLECYSLTRLPWIYGDRSAIDRILVNIVSNAIKYTDNNGQVTVYMGVLVDDVYVKVSDTGFGIAEDKLPYIFDRFFRVDMTGSRMYGGTGLGLSIAKELAEMHLGDISVSSVLGKGTDFTIRLPFARKIFMDAAGYLPTGSAETEVAMYKEAYEALKNRAKEIGLPAVEISSLSADKLAYLISKTVYDDNEDLIGISN